MPIGRKLAPSLVLGLASADFSAAETEWVAWGFAVDVGELDDADVAEDEDEDDPVLDAAAVL